MTDHEHVYIHDFDVPPALPPAELEALLGGKGANLAVMASELGLPVPVGFTISTEACRMYMASGWPPGLEDELREHMERLGERAGRSFGDTADPLLVSVRSGAPVSMPGMMDTVLNVGLNESTAGGLAAATGDADFAADCLQRLRLGYREVIGADVMPNDPWQQLRAAIEAVFRSWNSQRAQAYRRREGLPNELGTAVTVQVMVFGNRGPASATGVLFTRNPATGERTPYGDVMFEAQGEDVVAGGHAPQPLSVLDERLPAIAQELRHHAETLERHYADLCDIEFTIEQGRLWLLQVRVGKRSPRAALRMAIEMAQDPGFPLSREEAVVRVAPLLADPPRTFVRVAGAPAPIALGLPASPGVASGAIVTSSDAAEAAAADQPVILVRSETSPEDVRGMACSAGVLTARGGLASHAAVVARGWGIPAVVGAEAVKPSDDHVEINGRVLAAGEVITIDGSTGEVFAGVIDGEWQVAPEAAMLLAWAHEVGIGIEAPNESPADVRLSAVPLTSVDLAADDVLRALAIKGLATLDQLAAALRTDVDRLTPLVDQLAADRVVEATDNGLRLTAAGKLKATDLFAVDREALGEGRAVAILDEFHPFDLRMKAIVTAWQVRDVAGVQVLNDHTDAPYDGAVLDDLAALHVKVAAWLSTLASALARLTRYQARLAQALDLARDRDQRFVASPRVDSYHGIWFELHEELIRLAGRKRSEETAAGRA